MLKLTDQPTNPSASAGFTMVELVMAMAVFSFMLLIIVLGFMNIVKMHNQAIASNQAQDSARTAMDELVRAVRDSGGVTQAQPGLLCLASTTGQPQQYYLDNARLVRADGCTPTDHTNPANPHQITSDAVSVAYFNPVIETSGPGVIKSQVSLTLTLGSANGTTTGTGADLKCGDTESERTFCSVVTLTSEAVQR